MKHYSEMKISSVARDKAAEESNKRNSRQNKAKAQNPYRKQNVIAKVKQPSAVAPVSGKKVSPVKDVKLVSPSSSCSPDDSYKSTVDESDCQGSNTSNSVFDGDISRTNSGKAKAEAKVM